MSRELPIFNKPNFSEPCNNCGYCCVMEACQFSVSVFGDNRTPCAALETHGDKFLCGLILNPNKYFPQKVSSKKAEIASQLMSEMLGIGKGCCSD